MLYNKKEFFASANSGCGFINLFPEIFSSLAHLYIIKGGSGTGKSSFMRKVASVAESMGYEIEYYLCSSDPESLDGVIIKDIGIGIIDGTSPHTADTHYPGAYDEIINMGDFWNSSVLADNKSEITSLTDRKSELYNTVYTLLGAAYNIEKVEDKLFSQCFNRSKAEEAILRLTSDYSKLNKGEKKEVFVQGLTMNQKAMLHPFEDSESIYSIKDSYGIGHIFMKTLEERFSAINLKRTVGLCALNPKSIASIHLHDRILFEINAKNENSKSLNMDRFLIRNEYREVKKYIRNIEKIKENIINESLSLMSEIKDIHFSLEKIYVGAMDFDKKEEHEKGILTKIFGSY